MGPRLLRLPMDNDQRRSMRRAVGVLALLALGLVLVASTPAPAGSAGIAGYEPLHTFLETIAIVIAALVFAVGWNTYSDELPGPVVLLSCAFLGVAVLDFSHAMSFAGMPSYVTPSGPEKAINFWLAARTLAALALLAAALAPWRPFARRSTRYAILLAVVAVTALAHWLFLYQPAVVPRTFIAGRGLTPFKVGAEYALVALYVASAVALWLRARARQPFNAAALVVAVGTMALSEVFFTLYASVTDIYNLMGHVYKMVAYLALYRAVFVETIERPNRRLRAAQVQLRRTLEAQGVSEQRLAQAARVGRIGVFDRDHRRGTIHWSPVLREIYGVDADEPITQQLFVRRVFPSDIDRVSAAMQRANDPAGDGLLDIEHRIVRGDGQIRFLAVRGQTFFDGEGVQRQAVRSIGAALDITERKRDDEQRRSLETQLRESQKMESIGTLAGGIAHDFNNILGAILGNVALARGDLPEDHPAHESLRQIGKASARARDLIQQILTFSRRQAHELIGQPLRPLVEESVSLLRSTLPARVELRAELTGAPLYVFADGTQIQQVLMNLCTNAWHALPDGTGTITVGLDEMELDVGAARAMGALPAGRYAHLWVRDTGSGMDALTRSRIFEPFFTTKPPGRGTGLGLSVVHGIVAAHRGAITVDSAPDEGSTFHIYVPAQREAMPAPQGVSSQAAGLDGQGEHVLYIDDDEVMVLMVDRLLRRSGYSTTCCHSAHEALAALRARPQSFDAVVTDYNMPGATGLEIAQAVGDIRPDLPVIISSGYVSEELRAGADRLGVRHLLHKEHTLEELPRLLRRVLAPTT